MERKKPLSFHCKFSFISTIVFKRDRNVGNHTLTLTGVFCHVTNICIHIHGTKLQRLPPCNNLMILVVEAIEQLPCSMSKIRLLYAV